MYINYEILNGIAITGIVVAFLVSSISVMFIIERIVRMIQWVCNKMYNQRNQKRRLAFERKVIKEFGKDRYEVKEHKGKFYITLKKEEEEEEEEDKTHYISIK